MAYDILICTFSYGGNGGMKSEHPDVRDWLLTSIPEMKEDSRIGKVGTADMADTPITMNRNRAVRFARENKYDLLLMLDSDMAPDFLLGEELGAKPFWSSSLDYMVSYGKPLVVAAPYCGPPPHENIYVFRWRNKQSDSPDDADFELSQFTREEAFERGGIEHVAALPTGLILCDVRVFELTEPKERGDRPWFYYEYEDVYESQKCSTEDVTATRDLSLKGEKDWGYNPVCVNWDAWAGHWKPKVVGKPQLVTSSMVSDRLLRSAPSRLPSNEKLRHVDFTSGVSWGKDAPQRPFQVPR
tara:strand:+ start:125 stop:1021 length:897 start_codon:yes stop_codon:yes gene_type:complete